MSFGRPPTFSNFQVLPPERGSFPLDHYGTPYILTDAGECTAAMREYLACLKAHQNNNGACRHLSKAYLACRMEKCVCLQLTTSELMEKDNLSNLGFADVASSPSASTEQPAPAPAPELTKERLL